MKTKKEEREILEKYIQSRGLKNTEQRFTILKEFLKVEDRHLTADDLYDIVKKKHPEIGRATVFRNLKLITEAGLASAIQDPTGIIKYEHSYKHQHHDHMICTKCGKLIEFKNKKIEELQQKEAKKYGFKLYSHTLRLCGICKDCLNK